MFQNFKTFGRITSYAHFFRKISILLLVLCYSSSYAQKAIRYDTLTFNQKNGTNPKWCSHR